METKDCIYHAAFQPSRSQIKQVYYCGDGQDLQQQVRCPQTNTVNFVLIPSHKILMFHLEIASKSRIDSVSLLMMPILVGLDLLV
jgi:hypothetical protein